MGRKKRNMRKKTRPHTIPKPIKQKKSVSKSNTKEGVKNMIFDQSVSNMPFGEGAVIFLSPAGCTGHFSFLSGRPLVVLKIHDSLLPGQVLCAECGTSGNLPGIKVSLRRNDGNGFLGDKPVSYIYPWMIFSISCGSINSVVGYIKPNILKAVRDAVAWHMGFSETIPPYMEDLTKDQIDYYLPPQTVIESPRTPRVLDIPLSDESDDSSDIGNNSDKPDTGESDEKLPEIKTPTKASKKIADAISKMSESEIAGIITCTIPGHKIGERFGVSVNTGYRIRKFIRLEYLTYVNLKKIRDKLNGSASNIRFLNDIEQAIVATYGTMELFKVPKAEWNRVLVACRNRFGFNPDIGRTSEVTGREDIIPELLNIMNKQPNQLLDVI